MESPLFALVRGLHPMGEVAEALDLIPECSGVYLIFSGSQSLLTAPYREMERRRPFRVQGHDLLYVGMANNLRSRVEKHLNNDTRSSSFRMSVGVLLRDELNIGIKCSRSGSICYLGDAEERLTEWIVKWTAIMIWPCSRPAELEKALIKHLPCPLNITDRRKHPFARHLMRLRSQIAGREGRARRPANRVPPRPRTQRRLRSSRSTGRGGAS